MNRTNGTAAAAVVAALVFAAWASGTTVGNAGSRAAVVTPSTTSAEAGFARDMSVHHQQAVEMSFLVRERTQDEGVRRLAYDIANTQANQRGMMLGWLDLWGLPKVESARAPMTWMGHGDATGPREDHAGGHEHGAGHDEAAGHADSEAPGTTGGAGHAMTAKPGALMPGMATKAEMAQLRAATGTQAEILYLQLMTDHHKGGVDMARGCVDLCTVQQEKDLARGMVEAQQSELALMADMLKERGAAPRS
ncbi:DUF305 domain-containing protein [Streptomyces sp. NPDC006879]|uniref:DUF305 domain-containing protein n=1 Tax=Streptomyces sp. NPDC006879 TaxID=3364767 RepID=UPI0036C9EABA